MVSIYCIEDINDLKYIGSTKQTINKRLAGHRVDECRGYAISSNKLNLYNQLIIYKQSRLKIVFYNLKSLRLIIIY